MKTVIISINAKNIHKALAPWCLKSYCGQKGISEISVIEATVNDNINELIGKIYKSQPAVAAFSCYIWNIDLICKVGGVIKKLLPDAKVVLGGPEVSFEQDLRNYPFADYIIKGEGEKAFYDLLCGLQSGSPSAGEIIDGGSGEFVNFCSPYSEEYFESFKTNQIPQIENQLVYYESSRGCPFCCSYCLSSAIKGVSCLPLTRVKRELLLLVEKGAKCVKFVDRTFNADKKRAKEILNFIYSLNTDCTFHFEVAADLFDGEMLQIVEKMPPCRVQFELGIQSVNEKTLAAVGRKTDTKAVLKNISKLAGFKNCHIHVDLIAGLPYETPQTFADAVNKTIECRPNMLQLGFLKMLNGARITKENDFGAVFTEFPPYEVLQTDSMPYSHILKLKRIESVIEKFYNSGAFAVTMEYAFKIFKTPYGFFEQFSDYCDAEGLNLKVSLKSAYTVLLNFLLKYGGKREVEHNIKLDCLSLDDRSLPDCIEQKRNRQAELLYRKQMGENADLRIEFFEFENQYKLFNYGSKNSITKTYEVKNINLQEFTR